MFEKIVLVKNDLPTGVQTQKICSLPAENQPQSSIIAVHGHDTVTWLAAKPDLFDYHQ